MVYELYGKVLIKRIRHNRHGAIGEERCGLGNDGGCADQKCIAKGKGVLWAIMNLDRTHDGVDMEVF